MEYFSRMLDGDHAVIAAEFSKSHTEPCFAEPPRVRRSSGIRWLI